MMNDRQFAKSFSIMIFLLFALTILLIIIGSLAGGATDDKLRVQSDEFTQKLVAQRTKPVGNLNVGEVPESTAAQQAASADTSASEQTETVASAGIGETVYNQSCHICHNPGLTGAPKPGDAADWEPRIAQGIEVLYDHAINGYTGEKGVMPPKGGYLQLSDDDVKAVVDYLVTLVQ